MSGDAMSEHERVVERVMHAICAVGADVHADTAYRVVGGDLVVAS